MQKDGMALGTARLPEDYTLILALVSGLFASPGDLPVNAPPDSDEWAIVAAEFRMVRLQ